METKDVVWSYGSSTWEPLFVVNSAFIIIIVGILEYFQYKKSKLNKWKILFGISIIILALLATYYHKVIVRNIFLFFMDRVA